MVAVVERICSCFGGCGFLFHWLLIYLEFVVKRLRWFFFGFFAKLVCQMSLCGSLRSILSAPVRVGQSVRLSGLLLKRLLEINTDV